MTAYPSPLVDYAATYTTPIVLDSNRSLLLIVDMQYASGCRTTGLGRVLTEQGREEQGRERFANIEAMIPRLQELLGFFRTQRLPVIYLAVGAGRSDFGDAPAHMRSLFQATNNYAGQREHEILDELKPQGEETVIRKSTISGFSSTGLEATLRAYGRDQLLVTGISTNMCVDTTARDAADRGFATTLVADCCAAAQTSYHDAALITFQRLFGRVASSVEVRAELTHSEGR